MLGRRRAAAPARRRRATGPPHEASAARSAAAVAEVLAGVGLGQEVGEDEIVTLFSARGPEVRAVAEVADQLRRDEVGDVVTWVANRNINYTNVCTFKCRFCAFSKGPLSLNLRGAPYLLELERHHRPRRRGRERRGHRGVPPGRDPPELRRRLLPRGDPGRPRGVGPDPHPRLHRPRGDRRGAAPRRAPGRLPAPPQGGGAGHAARHRGGDPRRRGPRRAVPRQDQHRAVARGPPGRAQHRVALERHHHVRVRSSGPGPGPGTWCGTRALQRETGGFTEFVPLPFVHMASPIYLQRKARRGPTFRETLLMHAVGRIAYRGWIPNIQASWVKMGAAGAVQALQAGVNDLGGTLMDENISRRRGRATASSWTRRDSTPSSSPWAGGSSSARPSTVACPPPAEVPDVRDPGRDDTGRATDPGLGVGGSRPRPPARRGHRRARGPHSRRAPRPRRTEPRRPAAGLGGRHRDDATSTARSSGPSSTWPRNAPTPST